MTMAVGYKREYADYTVREVDARKTYSIHDNEEDARSSLADAMRYRPQTNWMIVVHRHVIERLV